MVLFSIYIQLLFHNVVFLMVLVEFYILYHLLVYYWAYISHHALNILSHNPLNTIVHSNWKRKIKFRLIIIEITFFLYQIEEIQNINTLVHAVTAHFGNAHSCFRQTFVFGMNGGCFICRQYFSSTGEPLFLIGCFSSLLFGNKRMQTRFRLLVPSPHSAEHYKSIKNNQIFAFRMMLQ